MAKKISVKQDLDKLTCDDPHCDHENEGLLEINPSKCHPEASVRVLYGIGTGVVRIVCSTCNEDVLRVQVAETAT